MRISQPIIIFADPSIPSRSRRNATWRATRHCAPLAKDTNWDSCIAQRATSHPCGFVVPVPLSREYSEGAEGALKGTYTRGLHAEYTASCNSERLVITVADEVTGNTGDRTGSPARGLLLCADDDLYMRSYTGSYGAPLSALRRTPMAVRRVLRFHYFSLSLINPSRSSTCWGPL